ncbi:MAG: hypothetical protein A2017_11935 [Lentisphaerae bacterium GWF2_44_16]|nr:MAG: hypothetical protein A2017_11935 [Lentisphaerae bacterium GWF2_44_16]
MSEFASSPLRELGAILLHSLKGMPVPRGECGLDCALFFCAYSFRKNPSQEERNVRMKNKSAKIPEDVKDLNEFYRRMEREKRSKLLRTYFQEALYFKGKSDLLIEHVAAMVFAAMEENNSDEEI